MKKNIKIKAIVAILVLGSFMPRISHAKYPVIDVSNFAEISHVGYPVLDISNLAEIITSNTQELLKQIIIEVKFSKQDSNKKLEKV